MVEFGGKAYDSHTAKGNGFKTKSMQNDDNLLGQHGEQTFACLQSVV